MAKYTDSYLIIQSLRAQNIPVRKICEITNLGKSSVYRVLNNEAELSKRNNIKTINNFEKLGTGEKSLRLGKSGEKNAARFVYVQTKYIKTAYDRKRSKYDIKRNVKKLKGKPWQKLQQEIKKQYSKNSKKKDKDFDSYYLAQKNSKVDTG